LLPSIAIKLLLPKLDIDRIVGFTHPPPKFLSITDLRLVAALHPGLKVIGTNPTRIVLAEQVDKLLL